MADVSQIKLPNNTTYNVKDAYKSGVYTVIGTQTEATGSWTGALHGVSALYSGLTIMYYLPWAGSGNATLNLTLDDGTTTGAVNCYYNTGRLTTHYGKGCNIVMTYWKAGDIKIDGTATTDNRWIANANYIDGNDQAYQIRDYYNRFKAGSNKVFPYTIIMQCSDGRWESIVTSSSTGTSKARNTHGFRLGQIALMYANATYNENETIGDATVYEAYTSGLVDHRYSFNTANNSTNGTTAVKPVYLVGALNATDGLFYLDTTWWTQTLPTTANGKLYIYLGDAYDYFRMTFRIHHPIYWYSNGKVREFNQDSATVNGHTVDKDVPSDAKFTDNNTTYTFANGTNGFTVTPSGGSAQTVTVTPTIESSKNVPYTAGSSDSVYDAINETQLVLDEVASSIPSIKSVLLTSSMSCTYTDSSTIGYRTTNNDRVQVSSMTGYPTGKTILGYIFEYAYVGNVGEYYKIALVNLNEGYVYANSKVSGTVRFGLRVIYID